MAITGRITIAPSQWANALAEVAVALAQAKGRATPIELASVTPGAGAISIASSLASGSNVAILLGNLAVEVADAARLAVNAQFVAELSDGKFGVLTAGGNTVGGYLAQAVPGQGGKTARAQLAEPLKAYIVLHAEPLLDAADGARAVASLQAAQFSVALTAFRSAAVDWADVMLPIAPFTETSGTFVNAAGVAQSFKGTVAARGQSRPGWKVLRVLGNLLQLPQFDDETSEGVRDAVLDGSFDGHLSNTFAGAVSLAAPAVGLERVAELPIFRTDAIVRRSAPLQATPASRAPRVAMSAATLEKLGLQSGAQVRVRAGDAQIEIAAVQDNLVADGVLRLAAGFAATAILGAGTDQFVVERI